MNRFSFIIVRHISKTIIPYFAFSWLLLSVILFVQQASRYSDIFFNNNLPSSLIWQLTLALVPNVIAFTCPMAILVGVIIGISKLRGDSELVAIRAVGVSNLQISAPIVLLGVLLSLFTFFINSRGIPAAAQIVRRVAVQTALYKMESPIEPGVFNTEIRGFTVYVKEGDVERGQWKNIFMYNEDAKLKQSRLITSSNGRIDIKDETSELVLERASITTFSSEKPYKILFFEKVDNFRWVIQTNRRELIDNLTKSARAPDEMGLTELAGYAAGKTGKEKLEAQILWHRRVLLSVTPLIFALLGAALILRFNRGGRGFGMFLALTSLITYYLIALLGEQLARTGAANVAAVSLLPIFSTSLATAWLFSRRKILARRPPRIDRRTERENTVKINNRRRKISIANLTTGILDFDIAGSIFKYFTLTFAFLTAVYLIFTAFELWRFAGAIEGGTVLLLKYLVFLIPFIYIQISPSALMVAVLAAYVIKSRQNEIVIWTASGLSVYRLLLPCLILTMIIGVLNWEIQERYLPEANRMQDKLRNQLKNNGALKLTNGKYWASNGNRIYSFETPGNFQSGNEAEVTVRNMTVFQFSDNNARLESMIKIDEAAWENKKIKFKGAAEKTVWVGDIPATEKSDLSGGELPENFNPFRQTSVKPSHLNAREIAERIETVESDTEERSLKVALAKKYATPFLPLIITFFTAPFALALSRKGKAATVGYAVGIWLLFTGVTTAFDQFGANGLFLPEAAVAGPLILFAVIGTYLLTKVKT